MDVGNKDTINGKDPRMQFCDSGSLMKHVFALNANSTVNMSSQCAHISHKRIVCIMKVCREWQLKSELQALLLNLNYLIFFSWGAWGDLGAHVHHQHIGSHTHTHNHFANWPFNKCILVYVEGVGVHFYKAVPNDSSRSVNLTVSKPRS